MADWERGLSSWNKEYTRDTKRQVSSRARQDRFRQTVADVVLAICTGKIKISTVMKHPNNYAEQMVALELNHRLRTLQRDNPELDQHDVMQELINDTRARYRENKYFVPIEIVPFRHGDQGGGDISGGGAVRGDLSRAGYIGNDVRESVDRARKIAGMKSAGRINTITESKTGVFMKTNKSLLNEMRRLAGLPPMLSEARDYTDDADFDDDDPDAKIAGEDKRQREFEKKTSKMTRRINPERDMSKLAAHSKYEPDELDDEPPASAPAAKAKATSSDDQPSGKRPRSHDFSTIVKPLLARDASLAEIRAALDKAGVQVKYLHSRLHGLRKSLKEGYIVTHPQAKSFVLAENKATNQYQWIGDGDDSTALVPMVFESRSAANKVRQYIKDYRHQSSDLVALKF